MSITYTPPMGACKDCGERLFLVDQGTRWYCRNGCHPLGVNPS